MRSASSRGTLKASASRSLNGCPPGQKVRMPSTSFPLTSTRVLVW